MRTNYVRQCRTKVDKLNMLHNRHYSERTLFSLICLFFQNVNERLPLFFSAEARTFSRYLFCLFWVV